MERNRESVRQKWHLRLPISRTQIECKSTYIGVSFKGRTTEFGSVNSGSNPLTPAILILKGEINMLTKGQMIKSLKEVGIRKGDKDGATVSLEHLKTHQVINLYYQYCNNTTK